jgi:hypothetical protein
MTCDYPSYCEQCIHCKQEGEHMVGSKESGGPENFISCKINRNFYYYFTNDIKCPKFDNGEDDE